MSLRSTRPLVAVLVLGALGVAVFATRSTDRSGATARPAPGPAGASAPRQQHGVTIPVWWTTTYSSPDFEALVVGAAADGVDHIVLVPSQQQADERSSTIAPTYETATDQSLADAIAVVHRHGLRVVVKPHVGLADGGDKGNIQPADPAAWFASYTAFITQYARVGAANGVETFVMATELDKVAVAYPDQMRAVIAEVRAVFHGQVTMAIGGATHYDPYNRVTFWDALDAIGIDAYYDLAAQPGTHTDVAAMVAAWQPALADLSNLSAKWHRQVLFTEIGFRSVAGAAVEPWRNGNTNVVVSQAEQAAAFEATLQATEKLPWFAGMYIWMWGTIGKADQSADYTPHGKQAEQTLRNHWLLPAG